ncbi:MAG: 50S ribosome-binding GTPase [Nanoarchaeota archaeon]|nr:50S ribosome-binding GTPase [Nanoarchaeota archaeon]MBU1643842.1 50S ribosome-binding GTPase [Nanoarchaeota archaeon]MBU1976325.1 50S ribosome-binding GTPase [Nanoarchaeota archaeon]
MNFEKIPPVEASKQILDLAFRKAREKGMMKDLEGNWLQIIRKKESLKLDVIKDCIVPRLENIIRSFPDTNSLPDFYIKLMRLTLDFGDFKKSLGAVNWAIKRVKELQKEYVRRIVKTKTKTEISQLSKEFYGRVSSTLKQIDPSLKYLEESRKLMRTYPDIKNLFTVCIYGFPNVGKTTLLNKLTNTTAKVAAYAFTTKSINVGYYNNIQVVDVPGTLARKEKLNNIELQADIVLKDLADVVIFVFDLSEFCGYSVKDQEKLLQHLDRKKPVLIYLSKTDLPEGNPGKSFKQEVYSFKELKEKISELAAKSSE